MCPLSASDCFPSHISVTAFTVSIFLIYHRVVSINRPSDYEPDALPLRHDDGLSSGGFDPPHLESLVCSNYTTNGWFRSTSSNTASMLPLHYKRLGVKSAPPSHKSVIDFTMSRSTISMTFLIINPINRLNDFLPYGIYYHYCDKCPTFAHYQSLITFVALPKYHRVALTKAPMNSCHWMVLIHLP
jgi:hypothetical protein